MKPIHYISVTCLLFVHCIPRITTAEKPISMKTLKSTFSTDARRAHVKAMFEFGWSKYKVNGWPSDHLDVTLRRGSSETPTFGGSTILESLPFLKVLGLEADFEEASKWIIAQVHNPPDNASLFVDRDVPQVLGSLLSAYALTQNKLLLDAAYFFMNATSNHTQSVNQGLNTTFSGDDETGYRSFENETNVNLELKYLAHLTHNKTWERQTDRYYELLYKNRLFYGLDAFSESPSRQFEGEDDGVALIPSHVDFLLKAARQSPRRQPCFNAILAKYMSAINEKLLFESTISQLTYVAAKESQNNTMTQEACALAGVLASSGHLALGVKLAATCHQMCRRTPTGLPPKQVVFNNDLEAVVPTELTEDKRYDLEWHLPQMYYYMWKTTRNLRYRDFAWDFVVALESNCRTGEGYAGLMDVTREKSPILSHQRSHFLGRTLFYLYLTFADEAVLPTSGWFLTNSAKPLPVLTNEEEPLFKLAPNDTLYCEPRDALLPKLRVTEMRRQYIRSMFQFAWINYKRYGWGNDAFSVQRKWGMSTRYRKYRGHSIYESLPLLRLMDFDEEYAEARNWTLNKVSTARYMNFYEEVPLILGSLLSIYSMTGDEEYIRKAEVFLNSTLIAFRPPKGSFFSAHRPFPCKHVNSYFDYQLKQYVTKSGSCERFSLETIGNYYLEFAYSAKLLNRTDLGVKVTQLRDILVDNQLMDWRQFNLIPDDNDSNKYVPDYNISVTDEYGNTLNNGVQNPDDMRVSADYLQTLISIWMQSDKRDEGIKQLMDKYAEMAAKNLCPKVQKESQDYPGLYDPPNENITERDTNITTFKHRYCAFGGLFALTGHKQLAENITELCHNMALASPVRLLVDDDVDEGYHVFVNKTYIFRAYRVHPHDLTWYLPQTYFLMWRTTKDPKYRRYAWDYVTALETHTRSESGYSGVRNVYNDSLGRPNMYFHGDQQYPHFLSRTLFYLYLTFAPDEVMSLDKWTFNAMSKPLPILREDKAESVGDTILGPNYTYYGTNFLWVLIALAAILWVMLITRKATKK